jgi:hypothetical protein
MVKGRTQLVTAQNVELLYVSPLAPLIYKNIVGVAAGGVDLTFPLDPPQLRDPQAILAKNHGEGPETDAVAALVHLLYG